MAPRFIGKTSLAGLQPLAVAGRPALDQFAALRAFVAARAGAGAADLFAEPIVTWTGGNGEPGSVSWYADLQGEPAPLSSLPPERRALVETRLRAALGALHPLLGDAAMGPLLERALVLAAPESVLSLDDRPVLTGWGLARSENASQSPEALRAAVLGRYMPAAPPRPTAPPPPPTAASAPPVPRPAVPPVRARAADAERRVWNGWLAPIGLAIAGLFLALGLWLGGRVVFARLGDRPAVAALLDEQATRDAIQRERDANAALERDIEARRRLLAGNVCSPDPAQVPRAGPDRQAAVPPTAVPATPGAQAFQGSLADLLKQSVVLVVAPLQDGVGIGSGFFVTPNLIVTNRHVVEEGDPNKLFITNEKFGRLTRVTIVAQSPTSEIGQADFAVLKVDNPPAIQPLALSTTVATLDQVIAAGFPGLLLRQDESFHRLMEGDAAAIPQVILTDGRINAIQPTASGLKIMPHSAAVSGGNSGGPLVDACGRVVGVNTFIAADDHAAHANFAQKTDTVIDFLKQNNIAVVDTAGPCTPGAPVTPVTPAAPNRPGAPQASNPTPPPAAPPTPTPPTPTPTQPTPTQPTPTPPRPAPLATPSSPGTGKPDPLPAR